METSVLAGERSRPSHDAWKVKDRISGRVVTDLHVDTATRRAFDVDQQGRSRQLTIGPVMQRDCLPDA